MGKKIGKLGRSLGEWEYDHKNIRRQMLNFKKSVDELKKALDAGKKK